MDPIRGVHGLVILINAEYRGGEWLDYDLAQMHRLALPTLYLVLVADGIPATLEAPGCIDTLLAGMRVRLVGDAVARFLLGVLARDTDSRIAALSVIAGVQ